MQVSCKSQQLLRERWRSRRDAMPFVLDIEVSYMEGSVRESLGKPKLSENIY